MTTIASLESSFKILINKNKHPPVKPVDVYQLLSYCAVYLSCLNFQVHADNDNYDHDEICTQKD